MLSDLESEITDSLSRSGKGAMLANLAMGGFKMTGLAAGTTAGDAVRFEQMQPVDADLTALAALDATAGMLARTGAGAFAVRTLTAGNGASIANGTGAAGNPTITNIVTAPPGGRLTLTTATPILTGDVTSATTVYYTPHTGLFVPLYDGSITSMVSIGAELSVALDSASGHTGYHQSGKNFDFFIFNDAGTIRLLSGPAWTSDTARATALQFKNGFRCNAASMTGRFGSASGNTVTVAQDLGLYVGTVRMSADGTTCWVANPAAAAGGGACLLLIWNMYNRVLVSAASLDSTDTWSYTTATWRAANAGATGSGLNNRVSVVVGLNEDAWTAAYNAGINSLGGQAAWGVGLDVTNAFTGTPGQAGGNFSPDPSDRSGTAIYLGLPGLGFHFFQAVENGLGSATVSWYGDNGAATVSQMTVTAHGRM